MWNRHILVTRVPPELCYRRLRNKTRHWLDIFTMPEHPLEGLVSATAFSVSRVHRRGLPGMAAHGRFLPTPEGGTRIVVRFGMAPFNQAVLLGLLGLSLYILCHSNPGRSLLDRLIGSFSFTAFFWLVVQVAGLFDLAVGDKLYLLELLEQTLAAKEAAR